MNRKNLLEETDWPQVTPIHSLLLKNLGAIDLTIFKFIFLQELLWFWDHYSLKNQKTLSTSLTRN